MSNASMATNLPEPGEIVVPELNIELLKQVEQFLFLEARLQDENRYRDWETLWDDDAIYWVPANGSDTDPEKDMSIIYDHRPRIALRVSQYYTGKRHTAEPASRLCRVVSNIELLAEDGDEVRVASNAMIYESNARFDVVWATRNEFRLRKYGNGFKIVRKKVVLVNNDKAMDTISFLI